MKGEMTMKNFKKIGFCATLLVSSLFTSTQAFAANEYPLSFGTAVEETTGDNATIEKSQAFQTEPNYIDESVKYTTLVGNISSVSDVDWYVTKLDEVGELRMFFLNSNGTRKTSTSQDWAFYTKDANGKLKEIIDTSFANSEIGNVVYIKVHANSAFKIGEYAIQLQLRANPVNESPFEPNNIMSISHQLYEYAIVPKNTLISTSFENGEYDRVDNFGIETGSNKGKLSFEVRYPDEEWAYWQNPANPSYFVYRVYAEKKDGTFAYVYGTSTDGLKNQIYRSEKAIDNADYTGKYVLELMNSQAVSQDYQFKLNFVPTETEVEPEPEPEPEPTEPTPTEPVPTKPLIERISGVSRYDTSLAFTKKLADKSLDYVIIASGKDFPDALAGGPLNKKLNGTVLLVQDRESVITNAITESKRLLKPSGKVLLLGGTVAINENIESQFKKEFTVERVKGKNRVETSVEIAKKVSANPSEVFIVYGREFADALSIVPYATKSQIPVLLNDKTSTLSPILISYLTNTSSVKKVTLIGGTIAIDPAIEITLKSSGLQVERISGSSRMETSVKVAERFYANSKNVGIAYGWNFADALSGSRFSLDQDMPILLIRKDSMPNTSLNYVQNKQNIYLFGGESVVGEEVERLLSQ